MLRALNVVVWVVLLALLAPRASADTIALLPLDADKRLEIYGQPVAAEIGRALKAAGLDIVVVGAKATVPETAQLIVDGSIVGKGKEITLTMRIRDPRDGTVLETLPASAATLTTIDKAAAELSAKVVPAVKTHLEDIAARAKAKPPEVHDTPPVGAEPTRVTPMPTPPRERVFLSHVGALGTGPAVALLTAAMQDEAPRWTSVHGGSVMTPGEVAFEVLELGVAPGEVPFAVARVRERITLRGVLVFDRVIHTDTIVGDRTISERDMAARVAREVLVIANAKLRRLVPGWR